MFTLDAERADRDTRGVETDPAGRELGGAAVEARPGSGPTPVMGCIYRTGVVGGP